MRWPSRRNARCKEDRGHLVILDGSEYDGLSSRRQVVDLPNSWSDQRPLLGFPFIWSHVLVVHPLPISKPIQYLTVSRPQGQLGMWSPTAENCIATIFARCYNHGYGVLPAEQA